MKYSKDYLRSIASNGYVFVFWNQHDNSYHFQKEQRNENGMPLYSHLRMLEVDIGSGDCSFLFDNDIENTKYIATVKQDIANAWHDHKECMKEGLLSEEEVKESLQEIEDMESLLLNMLSYQNSYA